MAPSATSVESAAFIGVCSGDPIPLPYDELLAHYTTIREAIAETVHVEHFLEPDLKALVSIQSFVYTFNTYKALWHLLPDMFHESGSVILRQLWEVSLNLHWIEPDPDVRARAFCNFTLMEQRKNLIKAGKDVELQEFDKATAGHQATFRFQDRKGNEQVRTDFAAKNIHDRAQELGDPWKGEYDLVYHLTSMHAHGAPGAVLQMLFTSNYSFPHVRERNSTALLMIIAIRVIIRNVQLLIRMGVLEDEALTNLKTAYAAFEETVSNRARGEPTVPS